jgi:hypothetical protein
VSFKIKPDVWKVDTMRRALFLSLFFSLFVTAVFAQNKPTVKIAVLGIVSRATNSTIDVNTLTELLQKNLSEKKPFLIVERSALSNILEEYRLDLTGLTENERPAIGSIKEADKLVVGSVSMAGKKYILIVKVLDVKTGVMDMSVTAESRTSDGLFDLVASLAERIANKSANPSAKLSPETRVTNDSLPRDGLEYYYPFNKNAKDAGPSANDGTVDNAVLTNDRFGQPRSAYAISRDFGKITTSVKARAPKSFTLSVWFRTDSQEGGRIAGFGDSDFRGGDVSTTKDRHLYLRENGRLVFGVLTAESNQLVIMSKGTYNDGAWHLAAAICSSNGMGLYVDGEKEASTNSVPMLDYEGYWRAGYDQLSEWIYGPTRFTLFGAIDDLRVFSRALKPAEIMELYREGNWEAE